MHLEEASWKYLKSAFLSERVCRDGDAHSCSFCRGGKEDEKRDGDGYHQSLPTARDFNSRSNPERSVLGHPPGFKPLPAVEASTGLPPGQAGCPLWQHVEKGSAAVGGELVKEIVAAGEMVGEGVRQRSSGVSAGVNATEWETLLEALGRRFGLLAAIHESCLSGE